MITPERLKHMDHLSSARRASAWRWFLALAFITFFLSITELRSTIVPEHGSTHPVEQQPLAIFSPTLFLQDGPDLPDLSKTDLFEEDRMAEIKTAIAKSEYHIRYQEKPACLQSPNRAHDLRISYHTDGFSLTPRVEGDRWYTQLRVRSVGHLDHEWTPSPSATIIANEHHAEADQGTFKIQYENDERGMRQDFLVMERPEGLGPLNVTLRYEGDLMITQKGEDDILFSSIDSLGNAVSEVWYRGLRAWDTNNEPLHAWASIEADDIVLHVDDANAEYPVTIDPLSTTANWITNGGQLDARFGLGVGTAGDVNDDGFSDVIIGAPNYDLAGTDVGAAFIYHGSATGLSTSYARRLTGQVGSNFGISVSTAGDINGDGYSDVVVGAPKYTFTTTNEGAALVYLGSATGIGTTARIFSSGQTGSEYGFSVATAGDVNGNDVSDLIVGAPEYDGPLGSRQGRVFVYHGNVGPGLVNTTADWTMNGLVAVNYFGFNVSSAGDVNNDGYSDILIGEPSYSEVGQVSEGRALLFIGSAAGVVGATISAAAWTAEGDQAGAKMGNCVAWAGDVNGDGYGDVIIGLSTFGDGTTGLVNEGAARIFLGNAIDLNNAFAWEVRGGAAQANFGVYLDGAGDVNGDGYADVIVGAGRYDIFRRGSAYVYLGSAGGVSTIPTWTQTGGAVFDIYGWCVGTAGDVNGDGYSDVLVGAFWAESSLTDEGRAYVYHGSPNGLSASGTLDQTQASAFFGTSVSAAGDVNGDGYSDVIVGAPQYDNGQTDEGRAYVYYGGTGGLPGTASWIIENNIALSLLGTSVSTAGDVNGNGYSDVIIGAPGATNGETGEGLAYVYFGSSSGLGTTPWVAERDLPSAALGSSVASAGDVNGDGYSDVVIGANGYSVGQSQEGAAYVHLGSSLVGLIAAPAFTFTQGQANARIGSSVAGVGDVTGDGYGDVLVGAPGWTASALTARGRAFLLKGHPGGVVHETSWVVLGSNTSSALGSSVAGAGDVNGDGYQDLIIGEPGRPNGATTGAGRALVFHGASTVPSTTPVWTALGTSTNAQFGFSVSKAGDVNKDGYGDVVVGSPGAGNGQILVYHGSTSGLSTTANSTFTSANSGARMGTSVSNSGSQSGDGYGDVIAGAPEYSIGFPFPSNDRGRVNVFTGNSGLTRSQRTRQYRADLVTPVQTSNGTFDANCGWTIGQVARSCMGRRKMKLAWEIANHGPAFLGTPVTNSVAYTGQEATWTTVNLSAGVEIKEPVIAVGTAYPKWRVRLRHHPATMIDGQPFGPWLYMGIHDKQDPAIKVQQPTCGLLPVELIAFDVSCGGTSRSIEWTTATEHDNALFMIERSVDTQDWETIGTLVGAGESQQLRHYRFVDDAPMPGLELYYRLQQIDHDGESVVHPIRSAPRCLEIEGPDHIIVPNPTSGDARLVFIGPGTSTVHMIEVLDIHGRLLHTSYPTAILATGTPLAIQHLDPATYIVRLSASNGTKITSLRFVVQ